IVEEAEKQCKEARLCRLIPSPELEFYGGIAMHKRKIAISLFLLAAALLSSANMVRAQEKTMRFGTLTGAFIDDVKDLLIQNFNKIHPDVKVSLEPIVGDTAQTLAAQAAAKNLPDVVFLADLYVVPFAKGGIVIDMEPLAKADKSFDLSDIYPNMLGLSKVNGKGLYMIPSSFDVVTVYYNKTMWEAAKARLPTAPWRWDDYIADCLLIKKATANYCFDGGMGTSPFWWAYYVPFIRGYGGDILSADGKKVLLSTPETLAGLQAFVYLWAKNDIAQPVHFDAGGRGQVAGQWAAGLPH